MPTTVRGLATSLQAHNRALHRRAARSGRCGARPCRPGRRASGTATCSSAPHRHGPTTSTRTGCWWRRCRRCRRPGRRPPSTSRARWRTPPCAPPGGSAGEAAHWLDHPSLSPITRTRVGPARALRRTRSGKHRKPYQPALDLLDRAAEPLTADQVGRWCDRRTRAQHHVLIGLVDRLEGAAAASSPTSGRSGAPCSPDPMQYHHGRGLGDRRTVSGIVVGPLLLDVPRRTGTTDSGAGGDGTLPTKRWTPVDGHLRRRRPRPRRGAGRGAGRRRQPPLSRLSAWTTGGGRTP